MRVWNAIRNFLSKLGSLTLWQSIKAFAIAAAVLVVLAFGGLLAASVWPNANGPLAEPVQDIVYLDQGWGPGGDSPARQAYYYTPQGTAIKGMRYSWFVNLERPWSSQRFADPEHMRGFGFLVDPKAS